MPAKLDTVGKFVALRSGLAGLHRMGLLPALVLGTTLLTCAGFGSIGPFAVKGYAWVLLFVMAGLHWVGQGFRTTFPAAIWLPWSAFAIASMAFTGVENAVQRTALLLCPCIVAASLAAAPRRDSAVESFVAGCRLLAGILLLVSLFRIGVLTTGILPGVTGLAGESMTAAILATLFAAEFASGSPTALWYWALSFLMPLVAVVRGAITATLATLPFTLHPMTGPTRVIVLAVCAALGLLVFHSGRIQQKMFTTGEGQLSDMRLENPGFRTSGRARTWEIMLEQARTKPWFGHGANANEVFIVETYGLKGHPHNDWIRLFFDYGYFGTCLFGLTLLAQTVHAMKAARRATGMRHLFLRAGASGFVPFLILMMTDNVVLYAGFFGNIHFALLGLGYSARDAAAPTEEQQ